jgi:hypothetical protein
LLHGALQIPEFGDGAAWAPGATIQVPESTK